MLLRSQIGGPATGDYLRLHPTAAITAFYPEPQNWVWGPPQAALSHEFANVGDGHGFLFEAAQSTTGLTAGAIPWRSGLEHKQMMSRWDHASPLISLLRERGTGGGDRRRRELGPAIPGHQRVGHPRHPRGGRAAGAHHEAAGAEEIIGSHRKAGDWRAATTSRRSIADLNSHPIAPRDFLLFSAHQMGTCRMGADPQTSVANPWGELHDTPGVWIGDASALPQRLGHEPDADDHGLARRTAHAIAAA